MLPNTLGSSENVPTFSEAAKSSVSTVTGASIGFVLSSRRCYGVAF